MLETKTCPSCGLNLSPDCFYMRSDREYTHSYCKICVNEQTKKRQRDLKLKAVEYKGGICQDCLSTFPAACYDFHHEDPKQKDFSISKIKSLKWSEVIEKELNKCSLLCANCHRLRHTKYK